MYTTIIEWHDANVERPAESGNYLAYYGHGIMRMPYSKKHNLFNACDWDTEEEAKSCKVDCKYWADFPKFPENESEDE